MGDAKHIYITDIEGEYRHFYGQLDWDGVGTATITLATGGEIHYAVGYFQTIAVLDNTYEEMDKQQNELLLAMGVIEQDDIEDQ